MAGCLAGQSTQPWHVLYIASTPPPVSDPSTFNGRPENFDEHGNLMKNIKGSTVVAPLIAPFYVPHTDPKVRMKVCACMHTCALYN